MLLLVGTRVTSARENSTLAEMQGAESHLTNAWELYADESFVGVLSSKNRVCRLRYTWATMGKRLVVQQ